MALPHFNRGDRLTAAQVNEIVRGLRERETLQKLMAKQVHEAEETNRRLDDLRGAGGLG